MKRMKIKLIVLFTIILSAAATFLYFSFSNFDRVENKPEPNSFIAKRADSEPFSVSICELAKNPDKFDGKTVRLKARITFGIEGAWFSDSTCEVDSGVIVESKDKKVWQIIGQKREQDDMEYLKTEIDLKVVGIFKNEAYDEGGLIAPFQFEILKVEQS